MHRGQVEKKYVKPQVYYLKIKTPGLKKKAKRKRKVQTQEFRV